MLALSSLDRHRDDTEASGGARNELHQQTLQNWLLSLLRLAVTHDEADRSAVLDRAMELDSFATTSAASFSYFDRTSRELCDAVMHGRTEASVAILFQHASRIDNPRLRQAFLAATGFQKQTGAERRSKERRSRAADLWRGLR